MNLDVKKIMSPVSAYQCMEKLPRNYYRHYQ